MLRFGLNDSLNLNSLSGKGSKAKIKIYGKKAKESRLFVLSVPPALQGANIRI